MDQLLLWLCPVVVEVVVDDADAVVVVVVDVGLLHDAVVMFQDCVLFSYVSVSQIFLPIYGYRVHTNKASCLHVQPKHGWQDDIFVQIDVHITGKHRLLSSRALFQRAFLSGLYV